MPRVRVVSLVSTVIVAGGMAVTASFLEAGELSSGAWALVIAAFAAGLMIVDLSSVSAESVGFVLVAAALLQFGPAAGILAAVAGEAGSALRPPRPRTHRSMFNIAAHALATLPVAAVLHVPGIHGTNWVWLALVPASLVYFGISSMLVALAIGWSSGSDPISVWRRDFRWLSVHYPALAIVGAILARGQEAAGLLGVAVFCVPLVMSHYSVHVFVRRTADQMRDLESANQRLEVMNGDLVATLSSVVDARDLYLYRHCHQASSYTERIARRLALSERELQLAKHAALLHDIGKIGIPEAILRKPGPLDESERSIMNSHALIGFEIVSRTQELAAVAPIVRAHHERFDGKGYPDGLQGKEIPEAARIISVLEAFDAMISDRPYRKAKSIEEALDEIVRCSGTQFDPDIVRAFLDVIRDSGSEWLSNSAGAGSRTGIDLFLPKGLAGGEHGHADSHDPLLHAHETKEKPNDNAHVPIAG